MLISREKIRGESFGTSSGLSESVNVLVVEMPESVSEEIDFRPEWQLALRVAACKGFSKSDLLPKFLLYVCEQQLLGCAHEITEQRIGTQIFNRAPGYNPGEDNIVRSYARLLRKRLEEYFEGEGRDEPLRIAIPRGGYVPAFYSFINGPQVASDYTKDLPGEEMVVSVDRVPVTDKVVQEGRRATSAWMMLVIGLVVGGLSASAIWFGVQRMQPKKTSGATHAIWAQLFQQSRNTLIVPADSGLGVLQNLTGRLVTLEGYADGSYFSELEPRPGLGLANLNDLRRQRYTSVVDLNITAMLTQLPEFAGSRSEVRYARNITTEDLKHSNAILLGSAHSNPWVLLFEKDLNFKLEYLPAVDQSFVRNEHPVDGEQASYVNGGAGTASHTYGAIDYVPSLDGTGHVLIIQGLNMAATQAAAETLFNSEEMKAILKQAVLPNGALKTFELLIETSSIDATAPDAKIIATRFHP